MAYQIFQFRHWEACQRVFQRYRHDESLQGEERGPGSPHFMLVLTLPRRPRIQFDDVPLQVVQRGHDREPCFALRKTTAPA